MDKNTKVTIITVSAIITIVYLLLISMSGLCGDTVAQFMRHYVFVIGKYVFAFIGLIACIFLPYRIATAVIKNRETQEDIAKDVVTRMTLEREQALQAKLSAELKRSDFYE